MIACEVCEIEIEASRHGRPRKYCSERCRSQSRRLKANKRAARKLKLVQKGARKAAQGAKWSNFEPFEAQNMHPEAQKWAFGVLREWEIPASEVPLVLMAGAALSRALEAREILENEGILQAGLHGSKRHPAVVIERDATALFARLLKQLEIE